MKADRREQLRRLTRRTGCAFTVVVLAWPAAAHGNAGLPESARTGLARQEAAAGAGVVAEPEAEAHDGPSPLLAVPYVAQEELLCGGAAAAMVLRFWGIRQDAASYAHLVDRERRGIPTVDLVGALRADGRGAVPFSGSPDIVRHHLGAGRPVIVLMEVRPGWYHYVVVVAWIEGKVVLHDPAIGPYRVLPETDFESAWTATGSWSLLVLPGTARATGAGESNAADASTAAVGGSEESFVERLPFTVPADDTADACDPLVQSGIDAARAGDESAAEARFRVALAACPGRPAPLRELAGLRFQQEQWSEAARLAGRATELDPANHYTRRLLASSRFLAGDRDGALEDWNRLEEPRVDLIDVRGLTRTRHPVVNRMVDLRAGDLLTREDLVRARRRLSELPTARLTRLRYEPPRDGRSTVVAAVVERPLLPTNPFAIAAAAVRAAVEGEAGLQISSPTGGGVAWSPWWRWGEGRSGAGLHVALPAPNRAGAVWSFHLERHEEVFALDAGAPVVSVVPDADISAGTADPSPLSAPAHNAVERTRLGMTIADWSGPDTRWELNYGWDRWHLRGQSLFFGAGLERRAAADRLALRVDGTAWTSSGARGPIVGAGVSLVWRSAIETVASPSTWHGVVGLGAVGGEAPLDLWPGAGQGEIRRPLLRAHPMVEDGAIRTESVGRSLVHGTLEYRNRLAQLGPVGLSGAVFTDVARVGQPATSGDRDLGPVLEIDAGAGLRLRLPGQPGVLRLDLAHGLLDGATSLSAGWLLDWRR